MVSILLIAQNEREQQILKLALEQRAVKVILCRPTYQHYMLLLQYSPDLVIMEFPRLCTEQIHFASLMQKNKRTRKINLIGYGDPVDDMTRRGLSRDGVKYYLERPLKFSMMLSHIEQIIKGNNKTLVCETVMSDKEKDLELILGGSAAPSEKIEAMIRHVSALLAFPFTVARVLRLTQDAKSGAGDLAKAITADPAITAHMLKVSNSVFFASSSRRISSVKDAIVRIGFQETKKIVMSMSVINLFDKRKESAGFNRTDFWNHSLAVGIIAERIARHMGSLNTEEAFLGGLLHDLGIMILDEFLPGVFDKSLECTVKQAGHFPDCQMKELGVNHLDLLGGLFPLWKIPDEITEAVTFQFKVLSYEEGDLRTPGLKLALCIGLANIISKSLQIGRECDEFVFPVSNELMMAAGLSTGVSKTFIEGVTNSIDIFRRFLHLDSENQERQDSPEINISVAVINVAGDLYIPLDAYLKKEGYRLEVYQLEPNSAELTEKFNLLIVWFSSLISVNFEKLTLMRDSANRSTPVMMVGPEAELKNVPPEYSCLPSSCDLRQLTLLTSEVASGKTVRITSADQFSAPVEETLQEVS